ncbi:hypothetical protein [uncultured Psychroserpens sp.]|uniref:hypothetical protein n=1 Tax=uncultured Psychroserpens sp. TaxID=255436 RepID=UPI0026258DC1|nr:hypothetical protein [uncultured Psychroserpens sp.]
MFTVVGTDVITDWVFVELRDKDDNSIVVDTQSTVLQHDGVGVSDILFNQSASKHK